MKRSLLFYISPCILAAVICLIGIISGYAMKESSQGWSMIAVVMLMPALFILLLGSFIIKAVTKGRVLYIWIIEAVVVAALFVGVKYYNFLFLL